MSRLDWRKTKRRPSLSTADEADFVNGDPAARWLKSNDLGRRELVRPERPRDRRARLAAEHNPTGLVIYADGACEPNPGAGGWGFVVYLDGKEVHAECGGKARTTNNEMEMTAALRALQWIAAEAYDRRPRLFCDSMYVVNGCNDWRHGWARKGWRRGQNAPLANVDLWREIDGYLRARPLTLEWCKGHAGIPGNERADRLSNEGRRQA